MSTMEMTDVIEKRVRQHSAALYEELEARAVLIVDMKARITKLEAALRAAPECLRQEGVGIDPNADWLSKVVVTGCIWGGHSKECEAYRKLRAEALGEK